MNLGIREINGLTQNANTPSMKTTLHLNNIKNEPLEPNGTSMSIKGVLLTDSTKRRKPSSKITRSVDWPVILRNTSTYNLTKKNDRIPTQNYYLLGRCGDLIEEAD